MITRMVKVIIVIMIIQRRYGRILILEAIRIPKDVLEMESMSGMPRLSDATRLILKLCLWQYSGKIVIILITITTVII